MKSAICIMGKVQVGHFRHLDHFHDHKHPFINTKTNTMKTNTITFVSSLRFLMCSLGRDWSESLDIVRSNMIHCVCEVRLTQSLNLR